jgi:hypothetical protein
MAHDHGNQYQVRMAHDTSHPRLAKNRGISPSPHPKSITGPDLNARSKSAKCRRKKGAMWSMEAMLSYGYQASCSGSGSFLASASSCEKSGRRPMISWALEGSRGGVKFIGPIFLWQKRRIFDHRKTCTRTQRRSRGCASIPGSARSLVCGLA